MKARVILSGPTYVDTGVHEWCSSLYPQKWGAEEVSCEAPPVLIYPQQDPVEDGKSQNFVDVSASDDCYLFLFGSPYINKWSAPIKVFDRGKP